ncbi:sulfite exporter TauE/SafE family protein [Thalassovita mediterranea]|nr:sulfite exporter TauE/SafE family protein [Thalassovita mediterranea]
MTDILALEGLGWLIAGVFLAGAVRGFSGFGAALVYMPIAGQFLPPLWALITLVIMEVFGPIPNLPAAWRAADRAQVARIAVGGAVALPIGLAVLLAVQPEVFRYMVSALVLIMPILMLCGLRLAGPITPRLQYGTGVVSGLVGGIAGLPGPPVILLYMASSTAAAVMRANIMLYLVVVDLTLIVVISLTGRMEAVPLLLGLILALPNLLGNLAGAAMFRPERQRLYRMFGLGVMMVVGLTSLPIWD